MFGHEKGSFTGAEKQKKGIFEQANDGTIFLDEIGDISPKMQVSLLRVLQEKKIQRVGGLEDISINVRVIAATNKNLEDFCEKGLFRWDLFFRLAITTLKLKPLRDWSKKEIKDLIDHLNNYYYSDFPNRQEKLKFSEEAFVFLIKHDYRGNIRELQNLIISFYTLCDHTVMFEDLPERITRKCFTADSLSEHEKETITKIFLKNNHNVKLTAEKLNISRETLYRKLRKYGIKT